MDSVAVNLHLSAYYLHIFLKGFDFPNFYIYLHSQI